MSNNPADKFHRHLGFLLGIYFLSGLTGLAYEVMWSRLIAMQFGTSVFGVISVVTGFMAGLGLGSLLALRYLKRFASRPLWYMALIELIIAVYALCLLPILNISWTAISLAYPGMPIGLWFVIQFFVVVLVLTLPALLMGAGFTLMVTTLHSRTGAGMVYGVNTLGAVLGCLIPLWLLPELGWMTAHYIIIVVNLILAGLFYLTHQQQPLCAELPSNDTRDNGISYRRTLAFYSLIGALAIVIELIWIRLFGLVLLRTEYVMAIILALYLGGIAIGSLLFSRFLRTDNLLKAIPYVLVFLLILGLYGVPWVSSWNEAKLYDSFFSALFWQSAAIALFTLPVTILMGGWYPLLIRKYQNSTGLAVQLYGVNAMGGALAAVLFGLILLPGLGSYMTMVMTACILLCAGLIWQRQARGILALPLLILLSWPVTEFPVVARLLPLSYGDSVDLYRYENALSINHVIRNKDGDRILLSDLRRVDASSEHTAIETQKNQTRLPLLLHESPKTVLFLGLGTGITAAGAEAYSIQGTAVELSQGAIQAATSWFDKVNQDIAKDMVLINDDIRRYLIGNKERYDVIIGDLFHPDLVGRGALLSVEQFSRTRARLQDNGLFVQWLALNQFNLQSLDVVLASFDAVFPRNLLFIDGTRLAMVGLAADWQANKIHKKFSRGVDVSLATGGEGLLTWIGRYMGSINSAAKRLQSEWSPVIEYALPKAKYAQTLHLTDNLQALLRQRVNVEQVAAKFSITELGPLTQAYTATSYLTESLIAALQQQPEKAQRLSRLAYGANARDRWVSFRWADYLYANRTQTQMLGISEEQLLRAVLKVRPDHKQALRQLWRQQQNLGNSAEAETLLARLRRLSPYTDLSP